MPRCIVEDCEYHDQLKGCTAFQGQQAFACGWGEFETMIRTDLGDFGDWRIKRVGSRTYNDVLLATLTGGINGKVEVWGGNLHRIEVWHIGKDKSEQLIATEVKKDDLRAAVAKACDHAGIPRRLWA